MNYKIISFFENAVALHYLLKNFISKVPFWRFQRVTKLTNISISCPTLKVLKFQVYIGRNKNLGLGRYQDELLFDMLIYGNSFDHLTCILYMLSYQFKHINCYLRLPYINTRVLCLLDHLCIVFTWHTCNVYQITQFAYFFLNFTNFFISEDIGQIEKPITLEQYWDYAYTPNISFVSVNWSTRKLIIFLSSTIFNDVMFSLHT